jgi:2,3-bisphosphoglycerate-dependent phosphoglycerate mutase
MAKLVLVRHGESEWNEKGLWTGWSDPSLTKKGHDQAKETGTLLKDITFDQAFTSLLTRSQQTLEDILSVLNQNVPIIQSEQLNERNYGDYTGKNKWEVQKEVGEEVFMKIRRSWDYPIPNGESLKQVCDRVIPYYDLTIKPFLLQDKNVIIAAHGNSLRALVKHLQNISEDDITELEIPIAGAILYEIDSSGTVLSHTMKGGELDHIR